MKELQFIKDAEELTQKFGTLELSNDCDIPIVKGSLSIVDPEGKLWHTYQVEIWLPDKYPYSFPIVFETGGNLPRIPDWHINIDGSCCLDNEFSQEIKCYNSITLLNFVHYELIPWLANQSYRRVTGNYVNGEQSHGDFGRIEFFILELKAPNLLKCLEWMKILVSKEIFPRQANCFCGSKKKLRNCHKPIFEKLSPISKNTLLWAIERFEKYLQGGRPLLEEIQKHTSVNIL